MFAKRPERVQIKTTPYPHVAIENSLTGYEALERDFPEEAAFTGKIRMHGDMTYPDPGYIDLMDRSPSYKLLHHEVYSEDFIKYFLEIFDEEIYLRVKNGDLLCDPRALPIRPEPYEGRRLISPGNVQKSDPFLFPRLDIGIGKLNYGLENGGGGIHVDNLTRLVSVLVYGEKNETMIGGEHRLYALKDGQPEVSEIYAPSANFMVASLQSNFAFHDVNPVTSIIGLRKAYYLAVSCNIEIWKPHSDKSLQRLTKNRYRPPAMVQVARRLTAKAKKVIGK